MSGGRVELGLGTGWFEQEHLAYGIPFPAKRFGLLEEQLEIVTSLWATEPGDTYSFAGEHYTLTDSPALPKPVQSPLPVIVGGKGAARTPRLAARFATEFNVPFPDAGTLPGLFDNVRRACEDFGRDPDDMVYSAALIAVAGADEAEFARRASAVGREPAELRTNGLAGTASEIVDKLGALREQGMERVYLQILDLTDLDHLDFIAREVVPQLAE
jgi:alkanesulfonate monooxygenase SsuD/methylene tetrahydromethanopterin reductase-like flavin-dependent oxidoreductase (luciferase family)